MLIIILDLKRFKTKTNMNNLRTVPYHKICCYNPKTDSTLWVKNYRIRDEQSMLWFTSDPKECALIVQDIDELIQRTLGMDFEIIHWDIDTCKACNWL